MTVTTTWNVGNLDSAPTEGSLTDVVKTVHWTVSAEETVTVDGVETTYTASAYGSVGLESPDADDYTAFADITLSGAIDWAKAAIGTDEVTALESGLANNIAKQKNPPIESKALPWA